MKNISKQTFAFLLCIIFILNTCIITVHASESDRPSVGHQEPTIEEPDEALWSKLARSGFNIWYVLLAQSGCLVNGASFQEYCENHNEFMDSMDSIWIKENVQVKTDSNGKKSLVFSKVVADTLIDAMKDANKKTENGGYELMKTVPVNKVSSLYFHNSADYRSMYDLLKDNGGIMGLWYSGQNAYFYKIEPNTYYVISSYSSIGNSKCCRVSLYKNVNESNITYYAYYLAKVNEAVSSWNDDEKLHRATGSTLTKRNFMLYDYYSAWVDTMNGTNPLKNEAFIVSSTGVSIPVFNTLKDLVAYTVANNLYYTTSDYTGEGQEVIIDYDELDKILSGYYNGMYDMLQRLIEQNGGNALTPEQVQALADQVAESFDMLKTEINKGFEEQDKLIEANSSILKSIKSVLEKGFEDLKKKLDDMLQQLEKIKGGATGGIIIDGLDFLLDLVDFVKNFFGNVTDGVGVLASGLNDTVNVATKKFPFSIPWDIVFLVSVLADAPETPIFEIPFRLSSYGIDETIVIDFSQFESISKISRFLLTMTYTVGLFKLTNKVIGNKKGGTA